ncbi:ATP synthase subunit C lysine N-methyltransferase-like [Lineus longissimus]|uniref:ATP synthase subunit C lysine N-methyltransferase-like n=1 Tax=Lineus longissimus TaxID=88925 RepID=UPI002B4F22B5
MSDNGFSTNTGNRRMTRTGWTILGVSGALFGTIYAVTTPFVLPALRKICLPYVPATTKQVENVMKMLKGRSGTFIDLGSGDGRIVIEAAKMGFRATGVELNPWLVWYSRISAWREGVNKQTKFVRRDLWKIDPSKYDNVVIFGVEQMMEPLEEKLKKELCADGHIVACRFPFKSWHPTNEINAGIDTVWLYERSTKDNDTLNGQSKLRRKVDKVWTIEKQNKH